MIPPYHMVDVEIDTQMVKILVLIVGGFLIAACADNHISSTTSDSTQNSAIGYLQGKVSIGPICPVESEDDPCLPDPSLYSSHKLVILRSNGESVKHVAIHGDGTYRTDLAPGTYGVDFTPHDIGIPGSFEPPEAIVREGETTILNIEIDTGIR